MDRPLDRKTEISLLQAEEAATNTSMPFQNQLLATKFYVPVAVGPLISRPRLTTLLNESLKHPLTLVSAPAGFGKTTLLSTWGHSLPANDLQLAWVSLDEEDNDPQLFWTYFISALQIHRPERFTPLLAQLQSSQGPPLKYVLMALINLLAGSTEHFVLILDDYQMITEHEIHTTLAYLVEHLPSQLRIMIATRADPPWPLSQLRAHQQVLEVRTAQLRCTVEETKAFFKEIVGIQFPDQTIQEVTIRIEGWLVGLQLLGLSLPAQADPLTLLQETSGDQRYILDYLTEEVLRRQPQDVQTFLLSTCILEQLTASLCDAVMQQNDSQQMLERIEQANLFVVCLDNKRQWYRYHHLFAQALSYRLEQIHTDLVPLLHHRASLWYAEQDQTTQAILHALKAHQWQWAADLIEQKSLALMSLTWGAGKQQLVLLRDWLTQLPTEVVHARPRLCLACTWMLWSITPRTTLEAWLNMAEATLRATLHQDANEQRSSTILVPQDRSDQENLLGEVLSYRAFLQSFDEHGETALALCQQALALLSATNFAARSGPVAIAQLQVSYSSCVNDAMAAVQIGLQTGSLLHEAGQTAHALSVMGNTAMHMIGTGQLRQIHRLTQQAIVLGRKSEAFVLPEVGWSMVVQADILREWNQLDEAISLAEEAISLCQQIESHLSLVIVLCGYAMLLRVSLSTGDLDAACSALQEIERISSSMNQHFSLYFRSLFTTIDQVRLWLTRGELDSAVLWAEMLGLREWHGTPFARERKEVARMRVLLAKKQPAVVLQRLEPVLERATTGKRWGHVIEMRLLQALAYQMCHEETQALSALSKAVRLTEPEGYIRSFVDEGTPIEALLSRLHEKQRKDGPTPYLDTVLAAFQQESKGQKPPPKQVAEHTTVQILLEPLSERELEVLQLIARGASNQNIAQELVIVVDTVKRHVSHIFVKLDVQNRVQAARRARELGLLDEEHM